MLIFDIITLQIVPVLFKGIYKINRKQMIKSKVIDSLKKLNKDELKEFSEFVNSPFYNKNKNVTALLGAIKKYWPGFENRNFTKENIYAILFPANEYADKTIRNLMSDLYSLLAKYLTVKNLEKRKLLSKYLLISALEERALLKQAEHNIEEAGEILKQEPFDGGNVFYFNHLIEMEKDYIQIYRNKLIGLNMKEGEYLIYAFFAKYMAFKMKSINYRHKNESEKLSEFISEFEQKVDLDKWIEYLELTGGFEAEVILTYYYTTRFMSDLNDSVSFNRALELFYKHKSRIDRTETTNLYLTFTGYCAVKISKGEKKYNKTLFELYERMFEENLLMNENEQHLHITIYNNIVTSALSLGKNDWTKSFIDKFADKLLPEFRDSMYNYTVSRYYFAVGKFETSLEHLSRVTNDNYWVRSRSKILQLRIYYELGHIDSFLSLYDAIKHSLKTDKQLPGRERDNDEVFIGLLHRLLKVKLKESTEDIEAIRIEADKSLKGQLHEWMSIKICEISH